ncbi:hypothetical protein [Rhizobium sp. J15]|uniref:hypothetical protein n=1 Tax=Rhizobium sp. J15 TaxID=2035450 RepID=UPI0011415D16|nr:hypothetical protein [Rhizobium sp. J15]
MNYCTVEPVRSDALDFPSRHAWNLFLALNHPAVDEKIERGMPDCSKPIGSPGTTSVWETWRNAATEVFPLNKGGVEPPQWNDTTLFPDEPPGSVPEIAAANAENMSPQERKALLSFHDMADSLISPQFSPGDGVFKGGGGFGETRMNRSTYEFIKRNCLWSAQGMQRYAQAILDGKKLPLVFDPDSIEVKAAWLDLKAHNIPNEKWREYYSTTWKDPADGVEKVYGLTSLHIITKDVSNWFWASFHHKNAPENDAFETEDSYGMPPVLKGTVWEKYKLGGTQTDFVKPTGEPTILSDYYVEFGFQKSSCISCHATSAIGVKMPDFPRGGPNQAKATCLLGTNISEVPCNELIDSRLFESGKLIRELGAPLPEWFEEDGKKAYFQTDFVWSIPFRASRVIETSAPPARCVW